jgi:hypothetical protein
MTHWTFEDSLKVLIIGAVSISFLLVDGPALAERLSLSSVSADVPAVSTPEQVAHQQALDLEQRYPMIDVLGYGHGNAKGMRMTFVLFGVVDSQAVQSREGELALALIQLANRLAEDASQALVVVHFSFSQGVVTGEFNCPKAAYASYEVMEQAGCVAALYSPDERSPLPQVLASWEGVGK